MVPRYAALAVFAVSFSILGFGVMAQRQIADAAKTYPPTGWTIHIDAKKHFAAHPNEVAHHFCKKVVGGLIECQLYDSDAPNARLVGVETVVQPEVYQKFSDSEKAKWHYHKTEIPKVDAKTPDMTKAEADKLVAQLNPTYGKVYELWDPLTSVQPVGDPSITIVN
jgi:hypothetical protein